MLKRTNCTKFLVFLLIAGLLSFIGGCQNEAKKPIPKAVQPEYKAPEVVKYKAEPTISLYRKATGETQRLKLEEYIKGVVAAEIGPKYPMEALKAQAIVARTMTLALLEYENGTRGKHNTDASDDHTEFQAYNEKAITPNISKAVEETRGQVITYKGKFTYALFHSLSKDKTASIEEGFPKLKNKASAYINPVSTNGIKNAPAKYKNWTVKVPRWQIKNIMGSKAGSLDDIRISKKGPSGRALTVSAGKASIPAAMLREKVGFDLLYSTIFSSIKAEGNYIVFKGNGWGHGCGMEQWGAFTMAKEGKNARQIIEHYFPATRSTQLYD
ncbi:MAG: SpoIID/LytB domain-containing protein [Syntrophomonadaceae bacterium]|nr:SpoIID/LytB domain-containing protein [Syntrophomonadaceae bacterium]MDD3023156.1 SpoIID/LytB domain-containing protein [Syntrophomonadaceae bacterium]